MIFLGYRKEGMRAVDTQLILIGRKSVKLVLANDVANQQYGPPPRSSQASPAMAASSLSSCRLHIPIFDVSYHRISVQV